MKKIAMIVVLAVMCNRCSMFSPINVDLSNFSDINGAWTVTINVDPIPLPIKCELSFEDRKVLAGNVKLGEIEADGFFVEGPNLLWVFIPEKVSDYSISGRCIIQIGKTEENGTFSMKSPNGTRLKLLFDSIKSLWPMVLKVGD